MTTLAVVINTKNAETTLKKALESVEFAHQKVVVDMQSSDRTREIARSLGAEVHLTKDVGFVEPARNLALSLVKTDWTLVLDADEWIRPELAQHIKSILAGKWDELNPADAVQLPRENWMFGQPVFHTGWWPDYVLRLFKTGAVEWTSKLHSPPLVKGSLAKAPARTDWAIAHQNYLNVSDFLTRMNRYTQIQAKQADVRKKPNQILPTFFHELFRRLFLFEGYKDGNRGLSLALLQAMSETVANIKLHEKAELLDHAVSASELVNQISGLKSEVNYWLADLAYKNSRGLTKFWWRLRRRFRL